eukprot:TRINITY_DN12416_c1_g1_i1.p1 TRINITY_DN12416_c1_g1~~TRINITY_DN12416_c1_g1_i1.p1  ORF type:complete len:293 (+),score=73.20 TRINITY_DN12416_c1_g1_i1:99-977(+)
MPATKNTSEDHLLLAVPKKGRLYERVQAILRGSGLDHIRAPRLDVAACIRQPVTIVFLPAADIAKYVSDGNVDMGITGEDIIAESNAQVNTLMKLGMGKCKLCFQAPKGTVSDPKELIGKRIVTSFPNVTRKFFDEIDPGHKTSIKYVTGSVEVAPSLGLADAVVDLVETGTTMRAAGLEAIGTIMDTQTVLISNPHTEHAELVDVITQRIQGYITASQHCMISYNCPREKLAEAVLITPGHNSPTVTPLDDERMVSVTALVKSKEVSDIMDRIKTMGGESIVVMDVINCRF